MIDILKGELVRLSALDIDEGATVEIRVKANRVVYGTLPAAAMTTIGPDLEAVYPGLVRSESVLAAGLNNANPIIHPPIVILNAGRIENERRPWASTATASPPRWRG